MAKAKKPRQPKHRATDRDFCNEQELTFVTHFNGSNHEEAGLAAGYGPEIKSAQNAAYRLLQRPCVVEAIKIRNLAAEQATALVKAQLEIPAIQKRLDTAGLTDAYVFERMFTLLKSEPSAKSGIGGHVALLRTILELKGELGARAMEMVRMRMTEKTQDDEGNTRTRIFDAAMYRNVNLIGDTSPST